MRLPKGAGKLPLNLRFNKPLFQLMILPTSDPL